MERDETSCNPIKGNVKHPGSRSGLLFFLANATLFAVNLAMQGTNDAKTPIRQPPPTPPASGSVERNGNTTVVPGKCYFTPGDFLPPEGGDDRLFMDFSGPILKMPVYEQPPQSQDNGKKPISL